VRELTFTVPKRYDGATMQQFLRQECGLSWRMVVRLKRVERGMTADGEPKRSIDPVFAGQTVVLRMPEDTLRVEPMDLPISVVFEDENLLVVDKPAYLAVHPSAGLPDPTLANMVAAHFLKQGSAVSFRPVNRLDRNTSGVVLIARDQRAAGVLARTMQQRQMKKRYLALLDGELYPDAGTLSAPIRRRAESIIFREVCGEGEGDEAITAWRVLARDGVYILVEASPETGRTHQLRVHFAHLGCPIHGDDLYGNAAEDMPRQALHASTLTFPHPVTGEEIILKAPLPEDFRNLLITLFGKDMLL